jgi:hypothetical protein
VSIVDQATDVMSQAAAEIERLRARSDGDARVVATYRAELDRNIAVNAELLEALQAVARADALDAAQEIACAAIAIAIAITITRDA